MVDPWVTLAAVADGDRPDRHRPDGDTAGPAPGLGGRPPVGDARSALGRAAAPRRRPRRPRRRVHTVRRGRRPEASGADPRRVARRTAAAVVGETVSFRGEHVVLDGVEFTPTPVHGRIPIWVAGGWPGGAPFRRAARFDGVWPVAQGRRLLTVDDFVECVDGRRRSVRTSAATEPFDACFIDRSPAGGDARTSDKLGRLTAGGMTWWIDSLDDPTHPLRATPRPRPRRPPGLTPPHGHHRRRTSVRRSGSRRRW